MPAMLVTAVAMPGPSLSVPVSPHPIPGAWGSTPKRRCLSHSTWHHQDTRTGHQDRGQHGGLRRQVRHPRVHPVPLMPTPAPHSCPHTQVCDTGFPISAAVGSSGTAVVAPGTEDTLGRQKGVGGQGVRECPPNGRESGEGKGEGAHLWQLAAGGAG